LEVVVVMEGREGHPAVLVACGAAIAAQATKVVEVAHRRWTSLRTKLQKCLKKERCGRNYFGFECRLAGSSESAPRAQYQKVLRSLENFAVLPTILRSARLRPKLDLLQSALLEVFAEFPSPAGPKQVSEEPIQSRLRSKIRTLHPASSFEVPGQRVPSLPQHWRLSLRAVAKCRPGPCKTKGVPCPMRRWLRLSCVRGVAPPRLR